jgi:hypothetical protein
MQPPQLLRLLSVELEDIVWERGCHRRDLHASPLTLVLVLFVRRAGRVVCFDGGLATQ